jgi:hypothetical protein
MVAALRQAVFDVIGSDIADGVDFLHEPPPSRGISAIITNSPYALAREFIERALHFADVRVVAMLLRTDFDHPATRSHLFAGCPMFAKKVMLTKRIRWFEDSTGSPSFNHCWMIWDQQHKGEPTLAYASGIARDPHSGSGRDRPPHMIDPGPGPYPRADSLEGRWCVFVVGGWEGSAACQNALKRIPIIWKHSLHA